MQRSSESIAKLASALAKAQIELVNPKKSLVATIYPEGVSQEGRTFNYASLASGLEIVRKTLGQHEIATIQTTAIDEAARIVKLTTVMAHSSGEWIASDWPVCDVAETATPQRMGMALTYARRNSLFALVGIAGEDDVDAPDLQAPVGPAPASEPHKRGSNGLMNGGGSGRRYGLGRPGRAKPMLGNQESAQLVQRILREITELQSGEDAALWAHRLLPQKNQLTAADAKRVEEAFQVRLAALGDATIDDLPMTPGSSYASVRPLQLRPAPYNKRGRPQERIDKSILALPEPRRVRDREHVRFVAKQPCLICGRKPSDAHHLRFPQSRALGCKSSDEFTVPLCRGHHRELHRCGDEATWWSKVKIDPTIVARTLWLETHPLPATEE